MSVPWPRLVVAQQTDPGREPSKQENEDSVVYQELHVGHLLLVCDGMGGHSSGREASQLAVQTIVNELARTPAGSDPGEALKAAVEEANRRVHALGGKASHARPGSTCVAVLVHPLGVEVAHLGDSRAYLLRAGQLWPLTRDHSMVQEMVASGILRAEDAINHPDANKITRALGMSPEAQVELRQERLLQQPGDVFLLVSDGVTDVVRDSDLTAMATISAEGAQMAQLCAQVVQLALARGGPDNTTILAASVSDPGLRPDAAQQPPRRSFATAHTVVETVEASAPQLPPPAAGATLPGAPAPVLAAAMAGESSGTSLQPPAGATTAPRVSGPSLSPSSGRTVPLAVHGPTAGGGGGSSGAARTVIDVEEPTLPAVAAPPTNRAVRVGIGLTMAFGGLVLMLLSIRSLWPTDESPPPLDDHASPSATAALPASAGAAPPSASAPPPGSPTPPPPATGRGR